MKALLRSIGQLFEEPATEPVAADERGLHLAAAMLLLQVARADHKLEAAELDSLGQVLRADWDLDEQELAELLEVAGRESDANASLHAELDLLNARLSPARKYDLILGLWKVAAADGQIHHYEEHLVRRLAELLYVPHREFIRAKHEATA